MSKVTQKTQVPLADVLGQLGLELDAIVLEIKDIEHVIAQGHLPGKPMSGQSIVTLQRMDSVVQILESLAQFSSSLAGLLPPELATDIQSAIDPIVLSELANRLRNCRGAKASRILHTQEAEFF